ncbi:caspase family protein [Bosea sp. (in: a-proteobacteria)]|uniref:caspase family protein n=1 Tax=Bosea sp. (in: a-proteobacteria) TaxID=1871050 RepID=UPI0025B90CC8|nr:caspase family protein [Bosea sp. (in: a-proteobacteria)]MBR3192289.1 caspase family protein [Bosea sp. (in: a-proteobacteria)]
MRIGLRLPICLLLAFAAIASALALSLSPAMAQQRRFAFVMGNGAYQNIAKLPNALNDANATRTMLQEAGFDVTAATDLSLAGLRSALDVFVEKVKQSGTGATALVYHAGHAVQLAGANYILPTDVRVETSANIPNQSLSLTEILRKLDAAGARSKIAILDACRNNPFAGRELSRGLALQMVDGANEGIRSEAGLARVDSSSGTFVAFATSPGSTAADGTGPNSPFTTAFLREAREPGLPIEQVFRRIRLAVYDSTSGIQVPWDTSSLITDVAFFQRPAGTAPAQSAGTPAVAGAVPLAARPTSATLRAMSPADAYRTAIAWDRRDIYRSALAINPDDQNALRLHRILAQRTEETAWAETVLAGDADSLKLFARLYPGSQHENEALRLAASAPSRNRVQVAQTCPVCPALQPRVRRADYTPRSPSPSRPGAPRQPRPVQPAPAVYAPPLPVILPTQPRWTGFYVGGSLGGGQQSGRTTVDGPYGTPTVTPTTTTTNTTNTSTTTTTTATTVTTEELGSTTATTTTTTTNATTATSTNTTATTAAGTPTPASWAINPSAVPRSLAPDGAGAVGGAQFGFNYQMGAIVIGAEADLSATRLGGSKSTSINPGTQFTTRSSNELSMLGTVRLRAGVVLGNFLIYGSGGYAYGLVEQKGSITPDNLQTTSAASGSRSGLIGGWAVGGGVEYAIAPGMTVRLDYTHYELGQKRLLLQDYTGLAPDQYAAMRIRTAGDIVKAGFNFGF